MFPIKTRTANDGAFDWSIPGTLAPGSYRIKVSLPDGSVSANSEVFTIH